MIVAVTNSGDDFLKYLNSKNLNLGSQLEIIEVEKYDNSMNIRHDDQTVVLSAKAAEKILVEKI